MTQKTPVVLIPARLKASRFPRKPLAFMKGKPMIAWVYHHASQSGYPTFVVTGDTEIKTCVEAFGGKALMTSSDLPSGTDRVANALSKIPKDIHPTMILNFQGDTPNMQGSVLETLVQSLSTSGADWATLGVEISEKEALSPHTVKVATSGFKSKGPLQALFFSRAPIPTDRHQERRQPYIQHLGVYAYTVDALKKFSRAKPTLLEDMEGLEQLRSLEIGLKGVITVLEKEPRVFPGPLEVNVPEDLEALK